MRRGAVTVHTAREDDPVSGGVALPEGLLPFVHVGATGGECASSLLEMGPPLHATACGCKSGFHLLPIGSRAGGD